MKTFTSKIYQYESYIDANQLYDDIESFISDQKSRLKTDKLGRGHPLQHILNSTSGRYVAPTSMKSFMMCPANYLYGKLIPRESATYSSIGTTFHNIMSDWYNLDGDIRDKNSIMDVANKNIIKDDQEVGRDQIIRYINGYLDANDYLTGKPMDHTSLICTNDLFLKPKVKPLGVDLGVPVYTSLDRLDIRDDGLYIVDYKTGGFGDPTSDFLFGEFGYLPQMIFYKWVVEAEYQQEVNKVFLMDPGADSQKFKYYEMNVNSLVQQSKVIDQIFEFLEYAQNIRETKIFPIKHARYCGSSKFCQDSKDHDWSDKKPIVYDVSIEVVDEIFEEYL